MAPSGARSRSGRPRWSYAYVVRNGEGVSPTAGRDTDATRPSSSYVVNVVDSCPSKVRTCRWAGRPSASVTVAVTAPPASVVVTACAGPAVWVMWSKPPSARLVSRSRPKPS